MQTDEIILLAVVFLVLLGGLVSLGMGHRRWSIGTVVAGFLVLLAGATFLYLASQLADRERAWARKVEDYRLRIAKAADDQTRDAAGDLVPAGGGPESLERLRAKRDRWRRGLDRVDTWRDRHWDKASLQPPKDDATPGRIELAAEGNAEDSPPIGAGSHVFLFDAAPFEEGGAYLGEFLVQATAYDQATKRHVLTVVETAPRDAYDTQVLGKPHDDVVVYETLPVDRWLAFYRTRERPVGGADVVQPDKQDPDKVREILESAPAIESLVQRFVETFRQHEEDVPKDEWEAAETEAADKPGTVWAEVEFKKPYTFQPAAGAAAPEAAPETAPEEGPKRDFEPGDRAEFDVQTAAQIRDTPPKPGEHEGPVLVISRMFRRRPLTDALTLLHGARAPAGDGIGVEGTATLLKMLQDELDALKKSNDRLRAAVAAAIENEREDRDVAGQLEKDLALWRRDSQAAADLVAGFERELGRTTASLRAAEAAIVDRGREFTILMTRLAGEIDRAAPPPARRAAKP